MRIGAVSGNQGCKLNTASLASVLFAAGLLGLMSARAADAPAVPDAKAVPSAKANATAGNKCASVVIRHCLARFVAEPGADSSSSVKSSSTPGHWEAVRNIDPDSDEILVEEERIRDLAVHEVFERYLRAGPASLITRNAAGGARCTTIVSTGATLCSHPGAETPSSSLPRTDFSDAVF